QKLQEPSGERAQMHAPSGGELEKPRRTRGGVMQTVHRTMSAPGALLGFQRFDVLRLLDLRITIEATRVAGDNSVAIEDAHGLECGKHLESAADMGVRDRVVVEIEANVGSLVRTSDHALCRREGLIGQRQESGLLGLKALADAATAVLGTGALCRLAAAPGERLGVKVGQIGEAPCRKEALTYEADCPLDTSLLVATGHRHGPWREPVPGRELKECGMEADGIGRALKMHALEHGRTHVVIQTRARHATEEGEGPYVSVEEAAHTCPEVEAQEQVSRVGEHHDERHERPQRLTDGELAE